MPKSAESVTIKVVYEEYTCIGVIEATGGRIGFAIRDRRRKGPNDPAGGFLDEVVVAVSVGSSEQIIRVQEWIVGG